MKIALILNFCHLMVPGTVSQQIIGYGVSSDEKKEILNKHNELRSFLKDGLIEGQPRAEYMTALLQEYDESLSAAAQNITNKCEFEHFSVDDSRWWFVGQNMYLFSTTSPTLKRTWSYVIDKWFGEHIYYIYPDGPSDGTVHYTQIASIYTEYVGCGYTMFIKSQFWFYHLFICNYGPGGNYNGVPPYDAAK